MDALGTASSKLVGPHRTKLRALIVAIAIAACEGDPPPVSTHVEDWRDRVIYQIVVDRFANGDPGNDSADGIETVPGDLARFQGGDWRGVTEHLDYVARLGMSAIWISPPFAQVPRTEDEDGYHGYWASDFVAHNPRFGSLEELRELVRAAHARGIAVIVDVVPNHAGRVFAYDLDRDGALDAPDEDHPPFLSGGAYDAPLLWAHRPRMIGADGAPFRLEAEHFRRRGIGDLGDREQRRLGDFPTGLRDLDTDREDVITGTIETLLRWVLDTDVDGFRIDAVPHAELAFWRRVCSALRARLALAGKHRFFLLGEIFELDPREIGRFTSEGALDAGFDFPLKFALVNEVILGGAPPAFARTVIEDARAAYRDVAQPNGIGLSPWQARVTVADNHDLPRIRSELGDPFAVDQALVAIFLLDSIPGIYYGTEQELRGVGLHERRQPLWDTGYREDAPGFALIARLAALRRGSIALRRGALEVRHASAIGGRELERPSEDAGLLAWERAHPEEHALVVLGTHPEITARATIATGFAPGTRLLDRLGGEIRTEVGADGRITIAIAPRTSMVFFAE